MILSSLILLIYSLSISRIQFNNPEAGVFFTPSRLYISLPLLALVLAFILFKDFKNKAWVSGSVAIMAGLTLLTQLINFQQISRQTFHNAFFPVAENAGLKERAKRLAFISIQNDVDLIIHASTLSFDYTFDAYTFHPLNQNRQEEIADIVSVNINGDRRSWLYKETLNAKNILLNGFEFDPAELKGFHFKKLGDKLFLLENPGLPISKYLEPLNLKYSLLPQ